MKVGIVIVTYNRSDVTCLAFESLATAKNKTPFELFVVDNASSPQELYKIKECFNHLKELKLIQGELIISASNRGFSGGNNLGLRAALAKSDITHICLLNNDTIVTPDWLDRILAHHPQGLIGPVSNSVGNEQLVPVEYSVVLANGYTRKIVWDFAKNWHLDHDQQIVDTDMLGFFCVLGRREVYEKVGELDEAFGIGTFEDDDYCLRVLKAGFPLKIARDVFVHHWGSASFSRLGKKRLMKLMSHNRRIFETKHNVKWESPIVKLILGFKAEVENSVSQKLGNPHRRERTLDKFEKILAGNIAYLFRPFDPLNKRRRLVSFGLTFSPPAAMINFIKFFVRKPLQLKRYFSEDQYRHHVRGKLSYWKQAAIRLFKKKTFNVYIRLFPGSRNLICFPICPFSGRRQRPQQLIEKLSPNFDRSYWIAPQDATFNGVTRISRQIFEVFLKGKIANFYSTQWTELEKDQTDVQQLQRLVPRKGQVVVVVQSLYWYGHLLKLKEIAEQKKARLKIVYDCMDHHSGFGSSLFVNEVHEKNIINISDLLIASSDKIEAALKSTGKPVVKIKNACSINDFPLSEKPPRTRTVGYFGAIAEWFDWNLVKSAAEKSPDIRFELIGDFGNLFEKAHDGPANIHLLGEKPFHELKNYAQNWDIALIPFCITPLIEATNPVKLYEYCSLGIPVISTPIPEVMLEPCDVIIVKDADSLVNAIHKIFSEDSIEFRRRRRAFAEKNTWEARGQSVLQIFKDNEI